MSRLGGSSFAGLIILLSVVVLLPRLLVFPINEHVYGDAVSRTELAEQWRRAPHVITAFGDGAMQFGPLHLYLTGGALSLFDRDDASRLVSLLFATLTVIPLATLTRRYFDTPAAVWACLGLAVWGLHVQMSTTGGSEAMSLFLMWWAFASFARALDDRRIRTFIVPAVALNLACATRYDAWLYVPLLSVIPVWLWRDKRSGMLHGSVFFLMCLPLPTLWLYGNAMAHGDAFYPFAYIDAFHEAWAAESSGGWREWWLRAQGLGFWPAMALFTLTPGVALFGVIGMAAAWRERPSTRWLVLAAVLPTLYYAFRTAVLFDFVPLGRFTVIQVSLLLPFVAEGFSCCAARLGRRSTTRLATAAVVVALIMPVGLGFYTMLDDGRMARALRPLSPTAVNDRNVMAAAAFVRDRMAGSARTIALDSETGYQDLQLGFYARLPDDRTLRMRWPDVSARVQRSPPDLIVLFAHGMLKHQPWVRLEGGSLTIGGASYAPVADFDEVVRVYERTAGLRHNR